MTVSRGSLACPVVIIVLALAPSAPAATEGRIRIGEINSDSGTDATFATPYRAAVDMARKLRPAS